MSSQIVIEAAGVSAAASSGDAAAWVELTGPGPESARARVVVFGTGAAAVRAVLLDALGALAAAESDRLALAEVRAAAQAARWGAPAGATENELRALAGDR